MLKNIIYTVLIVAFFMAFMLIGSAYEEHARCLNGYTEVCIPEDFE